MKKLRNIIIALLVTIVPASLTISDDSTVQAHGPETTYSCQNVTPNVWPSNAGNCNTNGSVPNLLNGINRDQYPNGLCFPSFNNYTDSWAVDDDGNPYYENGVLSSADPLASPLFVDERNFVQAAIKKTNLEWQDFGDTLNIKAGDSIQVYMFMHNDGDPCFNEHQKGIIGGIMTTSFNTKANFLPSDLSVNHYTQNGIKKFEIEETTTLNGNIWSNNAVNKNNVVGGKQSNGITVIPPSGQKLIMEFNPSDAQILYYDNDETGQGAHNFPLSSALNFFSDGGLNLSTFQLGATNASQLKSSAGEYYASEPYIALLRFEFKVTAAPIVCTDLTASAPIKLDPQVVIQETGQSNLGAMYKLGIDNLDFENLNFPPAEAKLRWTSGDPNGKFWVPGFFGGLSSVGNSYEVFANNFLSTNPDLNQLFYTGNGPINVEVIPSSISGPACKDTIQLPTLMCTNLTADIDANNPVEINNETAYRVFVTNLTFSDGNVPSGTQIAWQNNATDAKFYRKNTNGTYTVIGTNFALTNIGENVYTVGTGLIEVFVSVPGGGVNTSQCLDKFSTPEPKICQAVRINHHSTIFDDRVSIFEAKGIGNGGSDFNGKITYTVAEGHGEFYSINPGSSFTPNSANFVTEFNSSTPINVPSGGFCGGIEEPATASGAILALIGDPNTALQMTNSILLEKSEQQKEILENIQGLAGEKLNNAASFGQISVFDFDEGLLPNPFEDDLDQPINAPFIESLISGQSITVNPGQRVWFVAEEPGEDVIKVQVNCTDSYNCIRYFDITPLPTVNQCAQLDITGNPANPMVGQSTTLNLSGTDINGNPLPANTAILWSTTAGGSFTSASGTPTTFGQNPVQYSGATSAGQISAKIAPTDPLYSPVCADTLNIQENLICQSINLTISDINGTNVNQLNPNNLYRAYGSGIYNQPVTGGKITYAINPNYGFILEYKVVSRTMQNIVDNIVKGLIANNALNQNALFNSELSAFITVTNKTTVKDNQTVNFVIFSNVTQPANDVFTAQVSGSDNTVCQVGVPVVVPPPEELVCEDLTIVSPDRPWRFTDGDQQFFTIDVDPGELEDDLYYAWEVTNGDGEWGIGNNIGNGIVVTDPGVIINRLENFDENTEVEVWATLDPENATKITQCLDQIEITTQEEPEIEKFVYSSGDPEDADDLINIGENTNSLTYLIAFDSRDKSGSVEITEEEFNNSSIEGSKGGDFDFEAMRINIIQDNEKYTILKTDDYDNDDDDDDFDGDDNQYDNLEDYEAEYLCDEGDQADERVCIDAGSFDEAVENFADGQFIRFENVTADTQILIKVQVSNDSIIDQDSCEDLNADDGCGELFYNKSSFEMESDDSEIDRGSADAEVIVICPYILTRTGGDVFFHDELDVGIDVAQCSEVKGGDNPFIRPRPVPRPDVPNTGAGDLPDLAKVLDIPSHDICRYSNLEDNIEGYNDVLTNFSSTICEVQAEVSDIWTIRNINEAINANIERISRFDGNLNSINTIDSMSDLNNNILNVESGVFVKTNGDLTIDLNILEGTDNIPAAQTYIVKGHDIIIKSDIKYGPTNYLKLRSIPSAAFIVIDGNIIIDNNVGYIDGILMAVDLDNDQADGKVSNGNPDSSTTKPLTISGSLIGDVFELFSTRRGVGDPTKDEGSVVIRYDERVLLNPPPGLNILVNITQSIIPN